MTNLWSTNTPATFWQCRPNPSEEQWQAAIQRAAPILNLGVQPADIDVLLALVLGEAQFGPNHWRLSSAKRLYYLLKPVFPRTFTRALRRFYNLMAHNKSQLRWPIEAKYVRFQWEVIRQLLTITGKQSFSFKYFWPGGHRFAFVLTHDVESAQGQAYVRTVANLEESFGFRSSFNFVPERYPIDYNLMQELRERGFEIGVHGLKHDGKLFSSHAEFMRRVERINHYLKDFGAVGFRAPLTHRHPEWMQALDIEYDLSFFDTDPFEPIPGGTMSIWPFFIGRFIELPYTLVQDYTLTAVLGEKTPRIWLQKVDFIEKHYGMVLVNTHPDYLVDAVTWNVYVAFLQAMKGRGGYWHTLPKDVAYRWHARTSSGADDLSPPGTVRGKIKLNAKEDLIIEKQAMSENQFQNPNMGFAVKSTASQN